MRSSRSRIMFISAIVLAVVAAWIGNTWVQKRVASNTPAQGGEVMIKVVIAAINIPYGQAIEERHLALADWPQRYAPPGAAKDFSEVAGKIARVDIMQNDVITTERIAEHLGGSRLASLIQPNKRAVSVRVNDVVGVSGFLLPGNRVDVLGIKRSENSRDDVIVKPVLEDILVIAVDQETSTSENDPKVVRAVTLELTPEESQTLVRAMHEGEIQLALRNPGDRTTTEPEPPPKPAAPAPKPRPAPTPRPQATPPPAPDNKVLIIRGTSVSEEEPGIEDK